MSPRSGPGGQMPPALDDINTAIRRLMEQPVSDQRAEEYRRLLWLWVKTSRGEIVKAA
ncbi:hypothetical protein [Streptomyces sp. NRRL B-1347]|uniref:hypothetical protein n=1 Tax=Streptomyces sp. NRRL B-1347 TaxID=1476877 RepID=UPI000AABD753|nr:hypothetical protein [Streptomyces sp. NRRL B-1347]